MLDREALARAREALRQAEVERDCLLGAIAEFALWDSRRAGHAAAVSLLLACAREVQQRADDERAASC